MIAGIVLFLMAGVVCDLIVETAAAWRHMISKPFTKAPVQEGMEAAYWRAVSPFLLHHYMETIGTVLVVNLCSTISLILLTEKSLLRTVKDGSSRMRERSREDAERRREYTRQRREDQEAARARREEARRLKAEEKETKESCAWRRR